MFAILHFNNFIAAIRLKCEFRNNASDPKFCDLLIQSRTLDTSNWQRANLFVVSSLSDY